MNAVTGAFVKSSDYYREVRTDLLALAPEIHGRVLEIGCAEGLTMEYLRDRFGCTMVGLDYCESAVETARAKGFEVHSCDLNREPLPFGSEEFDYIVIGDVLEHLYDPWSFMKDIVSRLTPDGTVLFSIPNVKHYSLLKNLILRDRWEYSESGLLDVTHIRFFTLDGIRTLLARSGLMMTALGYNLSRSTLMRVINFLCFNRLQSFFVGQYLCAAKKSTHG